MPPAGGTAGSSAAAAAGGEFGGRRFRPAAFAGELKRRLPHLHFGLGRFLLSSLSPSVCAARCGPQSDPWPCPLPTVPFLLRADAGARRQARLRRRVFVAELVRACVGSLNWLARGMPASTEKKACPVASSAQRAVLGSITARVMDFVRLAPCVGSGLGRSEQKFEQIDSVLKDLEAAAQTLARDLQPYRRERDGELTLAPLFKVPARNLGSAVPITASAIKFETVPKFDPVPCMSDPLIRAVYRDPSRARLHHRDWPSVSRVSVNADRREFIALLRKWDAVGSLMLLPASESEERYRCGAFAVAKDSTRLRQILNPVPENSRVFGSAVATSSLVAAFELVPWLIPADREVRLFSDDIADCYHQFAVSERRARRNHLRFILSASEASEFSGFHAGLGDAIVPCFKSLGMGDSWAVEIAQHAHHGLLQSVGLRRPSECVIPGRPLPRGPYLDVLQIDDHIGLELCRPGSLGNRGQSVFMRAEAAYEKSCLPINRAKAQRADSGGIVLGALLRQDGVLSAPPEKVLALMIVTARLAYVGHSTRKLLQTILGSWIFVAMFCRPALAIMDRVFKVSVSAPSRGVFQIPGAARSELLALALIAPLMSTDLRLPVLPKFFCCDASPTRGAIVEASVPCHVAEELWRRADHRGRAAKLQSSLGLQLEQLGARSAEAAQLDLEDALHFSAPPSSAIVFDLVEVSFGLGPLALHSRADARGWKSLGIGAAAGDSFAEPAVRDFILGLAARGLVKAWCFRLSSRASESCEYLELLSRRLLVFLAARLAAESGSIVVVFCDAVSGSSGSLATSGLSSYGIRRSAADLCRFGGLSQGGLEIWSNLESLDGVEGGCRCDAAHPWILDENRSGLGPSSEELLAAARIYGPVGPRISWSEAMSLLPLTFLDAVLNSCENDSRWSGPGPGSVPRLRTEPLVFVAELIDALPFRVSVSYAFARAGHMNVNEHRVVRTLAKFIAKSAPNSRVVYAGDSMVSASVLAKGRSGSKALNRIQAVTIPYLIGSNVRLAPLRIDTHRNPADDPTRLRELRAPRRDIDPWVEHARRQDFRRLDLLHRSDEFSPVVGRWFRVLVGFVCKDFDCTLGFPGEGPLRADRKRDLELPTLGEPSQKRRRRALALFREFLHSCGTSLEEVCLSGIVLGTALRTYGKRLYSGLYPHYLFVEAILAVRDIVPHLIKISDSGAEFPLLSAALDGDQWAAESALTWVSSSSLVVCAGGVIASAREI